MSSQNSILRVQINHIDYAMAAPGPLDNTNLYRVPAIRIYGESSAGMKACLYVHQVYPYFFVEYLGQMTPDFVNRYITKLKHSLNHAMAISMKRNPQSPKSQFVRAIVLVKGVHFYGFHANYCPFLKIYIADPAYVSRTITIMRSGTIMKTCFRVYESHLSYILQFLSDFGLYGCGWIDLGEVWQRNRDEPVEDELIDPNLVITLGKFKESPYHRQTRMPLEVDAAAHQILNRHKLRAREIHHKLTIPASPLPQEPLVLSVRELWEDERQRRLLKGLAPSPEIPKDPSAHIRGSGGDWVAEARWWEELKKRIERERGHEVVPPKMSWERWVMTIFESTEALWEDKYKTWKLHGSQASAGLGEEEPVVGEINPYLPSQVPAHGGITNSESIDEQASYDVEVDEIMLSTPHITTLMELEEAEWHKEVEGHYDEMDERFPEECEQEDEEDEEANEDGPPPTLHSETSNSEQSLGNPFITFEEADTKSGNQFKEIWSKITRSSLRQRSQAMLPNDAKRPTMVMLISRDPRRNDPIPSEAHALGLPSISQVPTKRLLSPTNKDLSYIDSVRTAQLSRAIFHPLPGNLMTGVDEIPNPVNLEHSQPQQQVISDADIRPVKRRRLSLAATNQLVEFVSDPSHVQSVSSTAPQVVMSSPGTVSFDHGHNVYIYGYRPPTSAELVSNMNLYSIPSKIYRAPHYSREADAPERPREYAGLVFHLKGGYGVDTLEEWQSCEGVAAVHNEPLNSTGVGGWEYASVPPSVWQVRKWLKQQKGSVPRSTTTKTISQIEGPTQANPYGIQSTLVPRSDKAQRAQQNMTVLAVEVFAPSKGDLLPSPNDDQVAAVFYSFQSHDRDPLESLSCESGIVAVISEQLNPRRLRGMKAEFVDSELDLLNRLIDIILEFDPDILSGWEVQAASWGYINARGRSYGLDLSEQISRAPRRTSGGCDEWSMKTTSTFKVIGRHVLNLWRIMRSEQTFNIYTFENVVFQLLRRRTPWYTSRTLTEWYNSEVPEHVSRVLRHFARRAVMVLEVLDVAEVVTKNAEFARVFGVDFFSVLSRGSQFKVESFMFRIAKPENFVLLSPSKQDVSKQNAAECMPLVMEPLSAFYSSPLVVLDFQSLYPSIMIAYNYCYSTCLGRITDLKGKYKLGVTNLRQPVGLLDTLQEHINVAPNGIMYVKETVRKGLLGRMLTELLDTRVMVKHAMKAAKGDKALRRILDARQLGLKFIANVTYGYTSATFSGRMPAVEIADSIVQSGRETLEKAIRVIHTTKKWGAKVVYGDTDSLFICLSGKTKEQAFRIGQDMADTITMMNPTPVKLKFEKVYLPCVLIAKKRYVGFKFETPDDMEPVFDAKGIETVRRDGVPAQQKMTETCLKILFRTQDLSQVKDYCCRTWSRILENKVSVQDFIFAKEVKMGTYSDKAPPPPGVTVAARRMLEDPNDEPQYGERIPYVISRGKPGARLVDRAISPHELFRDRHKRLDAAYYISRVLIPPLERIFNLVGADVRSWFDDMPKSLRADQPDITLSPKKNKSIFVADSLKIDGHFINSQCLICDTPTPEVLCELCYSDPGPSTSKLLSRVRKLETNLKDVHLVCSSCCSTSPAEPVRCESLDCHWMYERRKLESRTEGVMTIQELIRQLGDGEDDFSRGS